MLMFGFAYNNNTIIVKQGWRNRCHENKKILIDDINHILKKYEPQYGMIKADKLPMDALRVLLLTEGPYHPAWGPEGNRNYHYLAVKLEYHWISLSFLMGDSEFIFSLVYLALSIQGSFQSPVFYSFQLLDVIVSVAWYDLLEPIARPVQRRPLCHQELRPALIHSAARLHPAVHLLGLRVHLCF